MNPSYHRCIHILVAYNVPACLHRQQRQSSQDAHARHTHPPRGPACCDSQQNDFGPEEIEPDSSQIAG